MKFWEAMKIVDEGGSVRRPFWDMGWEVFMSQRTFGINGRCDMVVAVMSPDFKVSWYSPFEGDIIGSGDMSADDWEVVMEPKNGSDVGI